VSITEAMSEQKTLKTVVVIPARDEAARIGLCLAALNDQRQCPDAVLLLLNNCTDQTETIARAVAPVLPFKLDIVRRDLPPRRANAGHARRLGMALAARRAGPEGVLLTTDADTIVPPDWVRRNLAALRRGADVVCGRAVINPLEAAIIPAHLHSDDAQENRLIALLDDIAWMCDPEPHDSPPRHTECSGASLAVSVAAFDRAGGIPAVAAGEDRAFVEALRQIDARILHDPAIEVVVSGRIVGRAAGGMADTIRRRMVRQDEFTDDQVEPACDAFRRYNLRRRARRAWCTRHIDQALAADLDLRASLLADVLSRSYFGSAWAKLQAASPRLQRRRVRFADLPAEIARARALLRRLAPREIMAAE
jgi:glycosyltransferase involved in cell wall biosynthesis